MRLTSLLATTAAFAAVTFGAATARADLLSACGNVDVSSSANCTVETSGGCTASCTPLNFEASCSAQGSVSCQGQCSATADVNCTAGCTGTCETNCTANPGTFSCSADCGASCDATCASSCTKNANGTQCTDECKANCSATCSAQCTATPPSASCTAQCDASCGGSCTAEANVDCSVSCQDNLQVSCQSSLQGTCNAQCSTPSGALFCDGQFINVSDVTNCVDAIKQYLPNITVTSSASCTGDTCTASVSTGCAVAPGDPLTGVGIFAGIASAVFVITRRRRNGSDAKKNAGSSRQA